jgi:uncharacterized membrane protein
MECIAEGESGFAVAAPRNNSLTSSGRIRAYGFIVFVSLAIAIAFTSLGAWLILPFTGIELAALLLAWWWTERHAGDYERLTITRDTVEVETVCVGRAQRFEVNRYWAQVVCERSGSRLALRAHGREISFGRFLTNEQRLHVARTLKRQLGRN